MRVLMVCLGNICRSPMAEGILQAKALGQNIDYTVDSAGTGGWHAGEAPHPLAQKIAQKHSINISGLRARKFMKEDIQRFDRIYVMDGENYQEVKRICGNLWEEAKVDLILNQSQPGSNASVPDPWYENTDAAFEQVFELLNAACEQIIIHNETEKTGKTNYSN